MIKLRLMKAAKAKKEYEAAVRIQRHMRGYRVQKQYLFAVSNIKMDAQLEEFFLK